MDYPIRVLHIVQRMEAGGTQAFLMNLYRNMDRSKVQFDFLVEYDNKEFYDDEIINMGGKIYYTNFRKTLNVFKLKKTMAKILKEHPEYKIVHIHATAIGRICVDVAKKCGVKTIIAHTHNNSAVKDWKYYPKILLRRLYLNGPTDFFACSEDAGKYTFKNKDFKVIYNAIDSEKFIFDSKKRNDTRKKLGISDNFVVGNIGRLHEQKNHKFLIDIFEKIKLKENKAKLLLIGNGPLEGEIRNKIKEKGFENDVIILSNRNDIPELLSAMDIFILPSLFEGLGIVAIEAQASGIPCLVSDTVSKLTNITDLIEYLSLDESAEIWANKAIQLSKNELRHQNMQKFIIEAGFDVKETAKQMQEFYIKKSKN